MEMTLRQLSDNFLSIDEDDECCIFVNKVQEFVGIFDKENRELCQYLDNQLSWFFFNQTFGGYVFHLKEN